MGMEVKNKRLYIVNYAFKTFCFLGFLLYFLILPKTSSAAATLQKPPLQNLGLVGYWTMDGKDINWSTNTMTDKSGNGNNGTLTDMSTTTSPVVGKLGQALNFDGVNDYVDAGDMTSMEGAATASWAFWIKRSSTTDGVHIISKTFSGFQISYYLTLGGTFTGGADDIAFFFDSGDVKYTESNVLPSNTWTHVAVTYDGGLAGNTKVNIFVNGSLMATSDVGTFPTTLPASNSNVFLGARSDDSTYFSGSLDDVRIYSRALSASEISVLYKAGSVKIKASLIETKINSSQNKTGGSLDSGLVGLWSFNGADISWASNTAYDRSGQGNNGTLTNMSTTTSPTIGKLGQALRFDGGSNIMTVPYHSSLDPSQITISLWVKFTTNVLTANNSLIERDSNTGYRIRCASLTPCTPQFIFNSTFGADGTSIPLNTWTHLVLVGNSSGTRFYTNAVAGSLDTDAYVASGSGFDVTIGGGSLGYLNGQIDEVRIYNRALSDSEIKQLYNIGK